MDRLPLLAETAVRQSAVVTRRQLAEFGVDRDAVAGHIKARRWREIVPGALVLHLGPLEPRARWWLAVLAAGSQGALCAWTALELYGLTGWERAITHVVVGRGRIVPDLPSTYVHESRRHTPADIVERDHLPVHRLERAAVDAAGRIAHRRVMIANLGDIECGSRAMSEIDLVRLCRRAGLPVPVPVRMRLDSSGRRRCLDAEWELVDGSVVGLEIDGVHHMEVGQWYADLLREAELLRRSVSVPTRGLSGAGTDPSTAGVSAPAPRVRA
jgi:hypothetical protein